MRIDNIFAASLIALVFGFYTFFQGFKWFKRKRLIEDIPTSKIRSIAMGLVEVFGEAIPAQNRILKSPITNNDCVYYKYTVEEYKSSGKSGKWVTIDSGERGTYFYLKDDTGFVLVDPKGAEIDIPVDFEFKCGFGTDPPEQVKQFLRSRGISFEDFFGINKTMRFREYFIAPKDKLYIMGTAGDNPFVEEASEQAETGDVMIQKGEGNIYYISDRSEKELLKSMKWKAVLGVFGGMLLIVGSLFVILIYLGLV